MEYFCFLRRADDDQRGVRRALRRTAPTARIAHHAARNGHRPVHPGRHRRGQCCAWPARPQETGGQAISAWPAASRSTASRTVGSCGTGIFDDLWIQPAAGDAGGSLGVALDVWHMFQGQRVARQTGETACRARISGRSSPTMRSRSISKPRLSCEQALRRGVRRDRASDRGQRWSACSGPDGIRTARPGQPLHPGRRALTRDAVDHEPEHQVPGVVPSVRAGRAWPRRVSEYFELDGVAPTC